MFTIHKDDCQSSWELSSPNKHHHSFTCFVEINEPYKRVLLYGVGGTYKVLLKLPPPSPVFTHGDERQHHLFLSGKLATALHGFREEMSILASLQSPYCFGRSLFRCFFLYAGILLKSFNPRKLTPIQVMKGYRVLNERG